MRALKTRKKLAERRKMAMALSRTQLGDRPPGETMSMDAIIMRLDRAPVDQTNDIRADQRWAQ